MALNETTRNYFPGSSVDLLIEIVANHGGQFYFEMCWRDNWTTQETEDCFEPLKMTKGKHQDEETDEDYYELDPAAPTGLVALSLDLPFNRTCDNCILRWHWRSGNNWGLCEDGSERVGCGYQEIYRNCADISVKRNGARIGLFSSSSNSRSSSWSRRRR